jgi:hypothetical protein
MRHCGKLAGNATGLGNALSPSGIVDVGFAIFYKVMDQSSVWSPVDSMAGILMAVAILVILALVGVNMLLLLASGWVLAYGGVFFLGFGGSRWTSDMAINYYKTVLGVAAQLMAMVLLVGIGKTFLDDYYARMSAGISLKEMGVMLIVVIILWRWSTRFRRSSPGSSPARAWAVPASATSVQALPWVPLAWRQQRPQPAALLWPPARPRPPVVPLPSWPPSRRPMRTCRPGRTSCRPAGRWRWRRRCVAAAATPAPAARPSPSRRLWRRWRWLFGGWRQPLGPAQLGQLEGRRQGRRQSRSSRRPGGGSTASTGG